MRTQKNYIVGKEVAELSGLDRFRFRNEEGRYLFSERDLRGMIMTGKVTPLDFRTMDIEEVDDSEKKRITGLGIIGVDNSNDKEKQ